MAFTFFAVKVGSIPVFRPRSGKSFCVLDRMTTSRLTSLKRSRFAVLCVYLSRRAVYISSFRPVFSCQKKTPASGQAILPSITVSSSRSGTKRFWSNKRQSASGETTSQSNGVASSSTVGSWAISLTRSRSALIRNELWQEMPSDKTPIRSPRTDMWPRQHRSAGASSVAAEDRGVRPRARARSWAPDRHRRSPAGSVGPWPPAPGRGLPSRRSGPWRRRL